MKHQKLSYDQAVKLAAAILISAHNEYIASLTYFKNNLKEFKKLQAICNKYDSYYREKAEFDRIMDKIAKHRTEKEKGYCESFKKKWRIKPHDLTETQTEQYFKILESARNIKDNEKFYRSEWFMILTQTDGSLNAEALIKKLQKEANYDQDKIHCFLP